MVGVIIVLIILFSSLVWVAFDFSNKLKNQYKYSISFKKHFLKTKIPIINIKIENKYYPFILDSGSQMNILDFSFVESLPTELTDTISSSVTNIVGVSNSSQNTTGILRLNLSLKRLKFSNVDFSICDLRKPFSSIEKGLNGQKIAGILGSPFFEENRWSIDFDKYVVWYGLHN